MGHEHDHGGDGGHDHGHVHGPSCGHATQEASHTHGPSCGHDAGHDAAHAHGEACGAEGETGHDHGHSHHHAEQPETRRPAEDGGPAVQLDLEALLPGERDERGQFDKLRLELLSLPGVTAAHLRADAGHRQICLHYDAEILLPEDLSAETRRRASEVARRYHRKSWFVLGMEAAEEATVIEGALRRHAGVLSADVAYAAERLVVEFDNNTTNQAALEKIVGKLGYSLEEPEHGAGCSHHAHSGGIGPEWEMRLAITSGVLMAVGFGLRALEQPGSQVAEALALVAAGVLPARASLRALRAGQVDIETLMVLAAVGAGATGAFFEGAFLLFLFTLGHTLEHKAMDRARKAVEALARLRPDTAWVRRDGALVELPVAQVGLGEVVVVRPGDRVPVDGTVREGTSHLDQAAITGESVPVPKGPGDPVFTGTVNTDGSLDVEVTRLSTDTTLARVVDMVAEAEARKSKVARLSNRLQKIFVPVVLIGAPAFGLALYLGGTPFKESFLRCLGVLVAASPCALAVSAPSVVLSAIARAARAGVLVKGAVHLDALGAVRSVAFDKTGTLTEGKPRLVTVQALEGTEERLLAVAASAEQLSAHPLAKAVVDGARGRGLELLPAEGLRAVHGKGLHATVAGGAVSIGALDLFTEVPPTVRGAVEAQQAQGRTTMLVAENGVFLGILGVMDTPRPEAREALKALKAAGVQRMVMLSGDNKPVADAVARELGLDEARAPLMPEGKVHELRAMARSGGVAMVGDGVNDAPALAAATVGVAMGGAGSDVALETADVVLMADDLGKLSFAVGLSRAARLAVRVNMAIALGVSAILVVASMMGRVDIAQAVVLHEGSTVIVVLNGLRLLAWEP